MRSELLSVVEGDGVREVADWLEATHACCLCCVGGRPRQLDDFGQFGFALDQREQAALVFGTDNGIALPVSQTGFAGDNGRRGSDRVRRSYRRACYSVFRAVVERATSRRRHVCTAISSDRCVHGAQLDALFA
jgi:hypothetical protein